MLFPLNNTHNSSIFKSINNFFRMWKQEPRKKEYLKKRTKKKGTVREMGE